MSGPPEATPVQEAHAGRLSGWQGVVLIAATYVYFLIFAQFGFLKRLDSLALSDAYLKPIMACMAVGGIAGSLLGPRLFAAKPAWRLRAGLVGCGVAAVASLLRLPLAGAAATATLIGLSLGVLTVTLVAHLRLWTSSRAALWKVGLGTGLGYALCNVPAVFTASPQEIGWVAAAAALVGLAFSWTSDAPPGEQPRRESKGQYPFWLVLAWFTALIWLDSAAFFIIQNSPALKSGTWQGAVALWRNAGVHLVAALLSVILLSRRGLTTTLVAAFGCLGGACLLLLYPVDSYLAAVLYPVGVSLYSVALVAAPSLLLAAGTAEMREKRAAWLYATAGWVGSALGIGMAQHLHRVPVWFVVAAAVLFGVPLLLRLERRDAAPAAAIGIVAIVAAILSHTVLKGAPPPLHSPAASLVERGRKVYISEGCIHCHSQYVRPQTSDVVLWGPAQSVEAVRAEKPPLIGNRRQGPDLSEVGARRSPLWLRIHFYNPRSVSYDSIMPRYKHLFADDRGDALIAYLESLRTPGSRAHIREEMLHWQPAGHARKESAERGGVLFEHYCAMCHDPAGAVRGQWGARFVVLPPLLAENRLRDLPANPTNATAEQRLEAIIKFGLPGTDMPGHEYLPDADVVDLAMYVTELQGKAGEQPSSPPVQRERK